MKSQPSIAINRLIDFYGATLTADTLDLLKLKYEEDLSFSEISENCGLSRQAVHNRLQKAIKDLEKLEQQLRLVERWQEQKRNLQQLAELLGANADPKALELLNQIITSLDT